MAFPITVDGYSAGPSLVQHAGLASPAWATGTGRPHDGSLHSPVTSRRAISLAPAAGYTLELIIFNPLLRPCPQHGRAAPRRHEFPPTSAGEGADPGRSGRVDRRLSVICQRPRKRPSQSDGADAARTERSARCRALRAFATPCAYRLSHLSTRSARRQTNDGSDMSLDGAGVQNLRCRRETSSDDQQWSPWPWRVATSAIIMRIGKGSASHDEVGLSA